MNFELYIDDKKIVKPLFNTYTSKKNPNTYILGIKGLNQKEEKKIIECLDLKKRKAILENDIFSLTCEDIVYVFILPEDFAIFCSNTIGNEIEISIGFLDVNENFKSTSFTTFVMYKDL